jgi:hypothetical protein
MSATRVCVLPQSGTASRRAWPVALGVGYSLTWVAGLSVWPSNLDVRSTGAQVLGAFTGHGGVAGVQYLLTEGLPALGLIALAGLLAGLARGISAGRARVVFALGALAGLVSAVQTGLGLTLALSLPDEGASTAHGLFDAVNRLDGVKMLLLAGFALAAGPLFRRGLLPRRLGYAGMVLAGSIAVSGTGYLLLVAALAPAAWVSLPALLVWVTGTAIAIGRSTGR